MVTMMIWIGLNSPKCTARLQVIIIVKLKEYDVDGGNDDKDRIEFTQIYGQVACLG